MIGSALSAPMASARSSFRPSSLEAGQNDMVAGIDGCFPAGLDDDGLVGFDDERRALEAVAGAEPVAADNARIVPFAIGAATGLLAAGRHGRPSDGAVGRQQARERMDQHRLHAERIGHEAGVLAAGAAEQLSRYFGDVIAALDGDLLDRVRHVLDGDGEEALGDLLGDLALGRRPSRRTFRARPRRRAPRPGRGRRWREECGRSLPSMTFASVTVSGPPRR
jgi:gas vesicle protein